MTTTQKLTWRQKRKLRLHAADIIDTAVEVLDATGWCIGRLGDTKITKVAEDGEHCAVGALEAAATVQGDLSTRRRTTYVTGKPNSAYRAAIEAVYAALPEDYQGGAYEGATGQKLTAIVDYNDGYLRRVTYDKTPAAAKNQLKRVFRKAAKQLRTTGGKA